jgi:hypothetical protein
MEATKKRAAKLEAKGKPVDFKPLLRMEADGGTTNIRNVKREHWTRWLGPEHRCLVPFNSFSEFNKAEGGDILSGSRWTRPAPSHASPASWTSWTWVRKVKEGETTNDLYPLQASPATCCASVARYRQPREKRSVSGEPAGYELSEEPHALRLACLPLCEEPKRSVHVQVGTRHPHQ